MQTPFPILNSYQQQLSFINYLLFSILDALNIRFKEVGAIIPKSQRTHGSERLSNSPKAKI